MPQLLAALAYTVWIGGFVFSLALIVAAVAHFVPSRAGRLRSIRMAAWPILVSIGILGISESLTRLPQLRMEGALPLLAQGGMLLGCLIAMLFIFPRDRYQSVMRRTRPAVGVGLCALLCGLLMAAATGRRLLDAAQAANPLADSAALGLNSDGLPVSMVMAAGTVARTDTGTVIPLHTSRDAQPGESLTENRFPKYARKVIESGPPDVRTNCFGWVFTGGKFAIIDQGWTETILADNGYRVVEQPQESDLVVYRDYRNVVVHVGVVKATGADDFVLVESKWGMLHRYLHAPEAQPFADRFKYYRSDRSGHLLDGTTDGAQGDTITGLPQPGSNRDSASS